MSIDVFISSSNDRNFAEPESPLNHEPTPSFESLPPVERRTLLAERLRCLSQELSDTQTRYDQCILQRIAARALGQPIDETEFEAAKTSLNQLTPEWLACITAISETNEMIRRQGIDTYELSNHLSRLGYQNPELTYQDDSLFDLTPSLGELLIRE